MADLDSGGHEADAAKISETRSPATDSADPYDVDPDAAAYAAGNNPELAHRYQGRPDSPNSWTAYFSRTRDHGDAPGHAQPANERADAPGAGRAREPLDLWGDVEPDAARYADLDRTANPGRPASPHHDEPAPDRSTDVNAANPDQTDHAEVDPERISSLEQQVSTLKNEKATLEAVVADTRQELADVQTESADSKQELAEVRRELADVKASKEAENADLRQQVADLQAKDAAREHQLADDRASNDTKFAAIMQHVEKLSATVEQLQEGREHQPDGTDARERTGERPTASADQSQAQDAASIQRDEAIAGQKEPGQNAGTKDAGRSIWRRAASAENVGIAGSLVQTADTVSQFAMHPGLEGVTGLTGALLGLASVGLTSVEKKRKGKS